LLIKAKQQHGINQNKNTGFFINCMDFVIVRTIFYKGLQAYNNLSMEVKQSRTVNEFKRKLNEHLNLVANSYL
jgi:hypothetical protein